LVRKRNTMCPVFMPPLQSVDYATAKATDWASQISNGGIRIHNDTLNMPPSYALWNTGQVWHPSRSRPSAGCASYSTLPRIVIVLVYALNEPGTRQAVNM
jgi:hypothetical protein